MDSKSTDVWFKLAFRCDFCSNVYIKSSYENNIQIICGRCDVTLHPSTVVSEIIFFPLHFFI